MCGGSGGGKSGGGGGGGLNPDTASSQDIRSAWIASDANYKNLMSQLHTPGAFQGPIPGSVDLKKRGVVADKMASAAKQSDKLKAAYLKAKREGR
jgi:hypothetical protein